MLYERNAALLVGLRGDRPVPRPSFFQLDRVRKARARGLPLRIIAHEDVLVFRLWGGAFGSWVPLVPTASRHTARRYRVEACAGHRGSLTQARRLSRR